MTRIKESEIGENVVPEYKSHPSRIIRSLRKGYDNGRKKIAEKSELLIALRGNLRDINKSREEWKARAKAAEERLAKLEKENLRLEEDLKKS